MLYKVHIPLKSLRVVDSNVSHKAAKLSCGAVNYAVQGVSISKLILNLSLNPFSQAAIYKLKAIF